MKAICKRELYALFRSLRGWGYAAVVLFASGIGILVNNVIGGSVRFEQNLQFIALSMIPATLIAAVDVFQAERRSNTERLLYSLPVSNSGIVLGKLIALLVPVLMTCVLLCVFPLILMSFGAEVTAGAYLGILLLVGIGITMMCIAMFVSAWAKNLLMAILGTVVLFVLSLLSPMAAAYVASASTLNLVLAVGILVIVFAATYLLSSHAVISVGVTAAAGVPVLYHYFAGTGNQMMTAAGNAIESLNLFGAIDSCANGIFDGRVLIGQLFAAAFFVFMTVLTLTSRRQAKRRGL